MLDSDTPAGLAAFIRAVGQSEPALPETEQIAAQGIELLAKQLVTDAVGTAVLGLTPREFASSPLLREALCRARADISSRNGLLAAAAEPTLRRASCLIETMLGDVHAEHLQHWSPFEQPSN